MPNCFCRPLGLTSSKSATIPVPRGAPVSVIHALTTLATKYYTKGFDHPDCALLRDRISKVIHCVTSNILKVSCPISPVESYPIYESELFTIFAIVLKRGATIPIHDHPNMTVFSKIVCGELLVKSYVFDDKPELEKIVKDKKSNKYVRAYPAICKLNKIIHHRSPDSLLTMHPNNPSEMHSLTAISDHVVILDIIGPPYNEETLQCKYFVETDPTEFQTASSGIYNAEQTKDCRVWLYEDLLHTFEVQLMPYIGQATSRISDIPSDKLIAHLANHMLGESFPLTEIPSPQDSIPLQVPTTPTPFIPSPF